MHCRFDDGFDHSAGVAADAFSPAPHPFRSPFQILLVSRRAMGFLRNIDILLVGAGMGSNPFPVMENGYHGGRDADGYFFADQGIANAVPSNLYRNLVVNVNFGFFPILKHETLGR